MNILQDLKFRNLIYQITDEKKLAEKLKKPIVLYIGFDPTADSLHVGSFLQITLLKRFLKEGHKPIALVGGATGMIGDPGGKSSERQLQDKKTLNKNLKSIKKQLENILESKIKVVNNYDWLGKIKVIDYLRDYGKHFPVNVMLAKETVKDRLEVGISFTEFNYSILQAIDFLELNKRYNCELQIGGSDQWGNITAGVDLIRRMSEKNVFGLTAPLVEKADGGKFGKTETGTIWLDKNKTSVYEFYQFWINTPDSSVIKFIKYFTFLSHQEIESLEKEMQNAPEKRKAQKVLAQELTKMVHNEKELKKVEKITEILFKGDIKKLNADEIAMAFGGAPIFKNLGTERLLIDLLTDAEIVKSKRQAREDIQNNAISLNGKKCNDLEKNINKNDFLFGKYLIVKKGKKNYFLIRW